VRRYIALERRLEPHPGLLYFLPVLAVSSALAVGAALLFLLGANPWFAYRDMALGAFGSLYGLSETLVKATPILLTALGVALAFRLGFWNIGAEGQLYLGALGGTWMALNHADLPAFLLQPLMLLAGCAAGAMWALIPAALRLHLHVNEIITTLMLNYVAILGVDFLIYGPWKDPKALGLPFAPPFAPAARLPVLPGSRVHLGLGLALLAAVFLALLLRRTRLGYEIRMIGFNPVAARAAGMPLSRVMLLAMALSGGLAGLAGICEVAGVQGQLRHGFSPGYGYTAIIVAWLGRLNPWGIVMVSMLLGGLLVGSDMLQITMNLPLAVAYVLQGLILFALLSVDVLVNYRLVWVRKR
jgi:ABC-type uncharacterized transport system permease subunit